VDAFLAGCTAGGPTAFPQAVRSLATRFPQRGLAVVVSDLMTPKGFPDGFRTLGALGHEVRVVSLRCTEDDAPDFQGEIELHDSESGQKIRLRVSRDLLEAYAKEVKAHRDACRDATRRAGGRFIELDVAMPLEQMLRTAFRGDA
jgi:uncharacterized protein (DUF58 family)